jgi:hypothetical protein
MYVQQAGRVSKAAQAACVRCAAARQVYICHQLAPASSKQRRNRGSRHQQHHVLPEVSHGQEAGSVRLSAFVCSLHPVTQPLLLPLLLFVTCCCCCCRRAWAAALGVALLLWWLPRRAPWAS